MYHGCHHRLLLYVYKYTHCLSMCARVATQVVVLGQILHGVERQVKQENGYTDASRGLHAHAQSVCTLHDIFAPVFSRGCRSKGEGTTIVYLIVVLF